MSNSLYSSFDLKHLTSAVALLVGTSSYLRVVEKANQVWVEAKTTALATSKSGEERVSPDAIVKHILRQAPAQFILDTARAFRTALIWVSIGILIPFTSLPPASIIINGVHSGAMIGLLGVSFGVIYNPTKIFHLAHTSVYAGSGYMLLWLKDATHLPAFFKILAAIVLAGLLGVAINELFFRKASPSEGRHTGIGPIAVSFGVYILFSSVLIFAFGPQSRDLWPVDAQPTVHIFGIQISWLRLIQIGVAVFACTVVHVLLQFTLIGRCFRAVSDNVRLAVTDGIDPVRIRRCAFFIGSCLVGIGGLLQAADTGLQPMMGLEPVLYGIVVGLAVQFRSPLSVFCSGIVFGLITQVAVWLMGATWAPVASFGVVLLAIVFQASAESSDGGIP
ncbi:MAG: branched-chain amino acid ABC transporter permease [Fimbriimonadaceae bacterium]|nr:branched-chain amino acid ABC transporter permease [Fimbriimonadaceae bacterium]